MTPSRPEPDVPAESIGALLARVRTGSGRSQLRVAELLCAASGLPTITRHEISRWEREARIPSGYWLRWLAAVLDVPLDDLERAAAAARARRDVPHGADPGWRGALRVRIDLLRRTDDLVGGTDLSPMVDDDLGAALARLRAARDEPARRASLALVAELAQLAGWVAADAGRPGAAVRCHRTGLRAAVAVGDRPLAGYLLGTLAHLTGPPDRAVRLAGAGYGRARSTASATTRGLLLHRVAFAAARAGDRAACERALAAADRLYDRRDPDRDPDWVYWFDAAEVTAMTGRCYAVLGRHRLAEPLLRPSLCPPAGTGHGHDDASGWPRGPAGHPAIRPRPWALYAAWLARVYLDAGEVEEACTFASRALLASVRLGSVRAWRCVAALHPRLWMIRHLPPVGEYIGLVHAAGPYLPDRAPVRQPGPGGSDLGVRCGPAATRLPRSRPAVAAGPAAGLASTRDAAPP
jgi:transcriptional regulator with XRE-family HTH domain